jgi:hypothetical protein
MTRKSLAAGLIFIGVIAGTASPALAGDNGSYVCVMATHDKHHPGDPAFCVWVPVDGQP